jgi:hypothetical protein
MSERCFVPWSCVQHTAERVAIVATGPSLKGVDLTMPDGVSVIAVNGALPHLPRADFWFTLDPDGNNRGIMRTAIERTSTVFYAAVPPQYGQPDADCWWYRPDPEPRVHFLEWIRGVGPKGSKPGLSTSPTGIHCGNSAYGALGLAFLMGAKRIALLGVDGMSNRYAWGDSRCGDMQHLGWLFGTAKRQLELAGVDVIVGSPFSRVDCWPRVSPRRAMDWLGKR